jgi:hypothetical protein
MQCELKIINGNKKYSFDVKLRIDEERILFERMPYSPLLNAEIKAMCGWQYHPDTKKWSVEHCPRNVIQLRILMGEKDVFSHFKQPLIELSEDDFNRQAFEIEGVAIKAAQVDMVRRALTYHYQILAAEQGLGKSLVAIEAAERAGVEEFWYVAPKSGAASVKMEFDKWVINPKIRYDMMTYEKLVSMMTIDFATLKPPQMVFFDESDYLKTPTTHRAIAAQKLADMIRAKWGMDGYVILLSGTPSAKTPLDIWSQCEICWPGYLREGSHKAFESRYAVMEEGENLEGTKFTKRVGWNEAEIAKMPLRYKGLMTVYRKKDWLELPEKKYRTVRLEPSKKVLRVAKSLCNVAPNTITALTWLRSLSSGFQYVNTHIGDKECPVCKGSGTYEFSFDQTFNTCSGCMGTGKVKEYERKTKMVHTPKDDAIRDELDKCDTHGRIVIAASFQGSIDRLLQICKERGWAVACVDGRGWRSYDPMGMTMKDTEPLDLWSGHHGKTAFVGNPGSCRYGLTLTLAHTLVFYDNSFSAVQRLQMEDRIHRMSMNQTLGATIVDLIHLPVDQLVVDTLKSNKKLELLSLGAISECIGLDEEVDHEEILD